MSGLLGLGTAGGGLGGLLKHIPLVGGALSAVAPAVQAVTSAIPGGAAANIAFDAIGEAANSAVCPANKDRTGLSGSAINV